jgi:glycosyltransferase involved in cell wall biosynthesis
MTPLRILLVSRNFFPTGVHGGAQVSVQQLGQALQQRGHDVAVLNVDDHEHRGVHEPTGLREYRLALRNLYVRGAQSRPKRLLWHAIDRFGHAMDARYRAVIEEFRPNIINTHVMAGIGLGIWRAADSLGVPVVHRVSDYYLMCLNSGVRKRDTNCDGVCAGCRRFALNPTQRQSASVRHIIYVSERIRAIYDAAGVFPPTTPSTILTGAYTPKRPVPERPDLIDPARITLGFFGRLSPEKGIEAMIALLRRLTPGSWQLRVGGDGDPAYVASLKAATADLPVTFLGYQKPDDFYEQVDALIVSSLWEEPSGRVAFESGIHGLIPIVSNRGGLPEMVDHGARGLVYDPERGETLVAAVERAASDRAFREAVRARWKIGRLEFDPDSVAERTLAIYRSVLASGDGAAIAA